MSKTDLPVQVDLWYTGASELFEANIRLDHYAKMSDMFGDQVKFQPRMMVHNCVYCQPEIKKQCIQDGKYCPTLSRKATTGNAFEEANIQPANLIMQSIREQCVYEVLPQTYKSQWFAYMDILIDKCVLTSEIERFGLSAVSDSCDSLAITELNVGSKGVF